MTLGFWFSGLGTHAGASTHGPLLLLGRPQVRSSQWRCCLSGQVRGQEHKDNREPGPVPLVIFWESASWFGRRREEVEKAGWCPGGGSVCQSPSVAPHNRHAPGSMGQTVPVCLHLSP